MFKKINALAYLISLHLKYDGWKAMFTVVFL